MPCCVLYLRVSTAEQAAAGHHSLDAQEILCRRYAESEGMKVVEAIRDEGYSGRSTNRPGFRRLLEYTGKRPPVKIDAILIQDTSRMGRNTVEYLLFRRDLAQKGITLVAVTQPNIDGSAEGQLMDTIFAGINQYQSDEKARRVAIAMQKKFEEGWWPGWAPLGYLNVEEEGYHRVVVDPERAPLITLAFREYATGQHSIDALLNQLQKKGLCDRNGRPISRTTFNHILKNPFYTGRMRWKEQERVGKHQALTDAQTWAHCQSVMATHNRFASRTRKHVFLLTGIIVCDACGKPHTHTINHRKRKRYYHCSSRSKCDQPYVPQEDLERQVTELVQHIHLSDAFIDRLMKKVTEAFSTYEGAHRTQIQNVLRRKTILEQQRETLEGKLLSGVLTDESFRRWMEKLQKELDEVQQHFHELEGIRRFDTEALREILCFARDIPIAYAQAPPGLQKHYLRVFFKEVRVRDKKIMEPVLTEFFHTLMEGNLVRSDANWLPRLSTIRTVLSLLRSSGWLRQEMERIEGVREITSERKAAMPVPA